MIMAIKEKYILKLSKKKSMSLVQIKSRKIVIDYNFYNYHFFNFANKI